MLEEGYFLVLQKLNSCCGQRKREEMIAEFGTVALEIFNILDKDF